MQPCASGAKAACVDLVLLYSREHTFACVFNGLCLTPRQDLTELSSLALTPCLNRSCKGNSRPVPPVPAQ